MPQLPNIPKHDGDLFTASEFNSMVEWMQDVPYSIQLNGSTLSKTGSAGSKVVNIPIATTSSGSDRYITINGSVIGSNSYPIAYASHLGDSNGSFSYGNLNAALGNLSASIGTLQSSVYSINQKIPSAATSSNQLADKAFVNSSIATSTATFRGTVTASADTEAAAQTALATITTKDANDYAFVVVANTPQTGTDKYKRYKYSGTEWVYEYTLNNSSFTASQWLAINSGITASQINIYDSHIEDFDIHITATERTAWDSHVASTSNPHSVTAAQVGAAPSVHTHTKSQITDFAHTHSEYVNQNAYSTIKVGTTNIAAASATSTFELVAGTNITLTPDSVNKKVTISATGGSGGGITDVEVDGTSVVTGGIARIPLATTETEGVMSYQDKIKLDVFTYDAESETIIVNSDFLNLTGDLRCQYINLYEDIIPYTNNHSDLGSISSKFANVYATNFIGNASTATKLQTARTISLTGDVTGSGSFDGSGNLSITTTVEGGGGSSSNKFMYLRVVDGVLRLYTTTVLTDTDTIQLARKGRYVIKKLVKQEDVRHRYQAKGWRIDKGPSSEEAPEITYNMVDREIYSWDVYDHYAYDLCINGEPLTASELFSRYSTINYHNDEYPYYHINNGKRGKDLYPNEYVYKNSGMYHKTSIVHFGLMINNKLYRFNLRFFNYTLHFADTPTGMKYISDQFFQLEIV